MMQVKGSLLSNTGVMAGARLLEINAPEIAAAASPGQFVMVGCGPDVMLRRPFSVHDASDSGRISIVFNVVGKGTSWLARRKKGAEIDLLGPAGNGFSVKPQAKRLLLIAGGMGIAPLLFLSKQALAQGKEVTLLLGARNGAALYPQNRLPEKMQTVIATEDGSIGKKGMVSDMIPGFAENADEIFACGPVGMYRAIADALKRMPVKKSVQVSLETRMGCGIGTCYGCSIRTTKGMKTVCKDGPIFTADTVIWQEVKV
jgi:dihydroorotate dehydrogenase electron transfer subunit